MTIVIYLLWLILAVALQVLLFNNLSFYGGIVFIYMVALLKMPVEMNRVWQIVVGFATGFIIDIFCNTPGMNALATGTVMFMREPILHLFENDPEFKSGSVSMNRFSMWTFFRYAFSVIGVHAFLLYFIEAFTLFNVVVLFSKIFLSIVMTLVISFALEFAMLKKNVS